MSGVRVDLPVPENWSLISRGEDGIACQRGPLRVIASHAKEDDGYVWLHVSVSREGVALPTWSDLARVKSAFIGDDREAYQVLPPAERHVNIHPGVLHLWSRLDGPALPDFTQGTGSI